MLLNKDLIKYKLHLKINDFTSVFISKKEDVSKSL